ncbi:MAG: poly(beta-D-mannuronate) lyase [Rhodocyclales bacterium]|nr:poly(beta-D-mannuronate) lyase [Rhodocyclales bacterium]
MHLPSFTWRKLTSAIVIALGIQGLALASGAAMAQTKIAIPPVNVTASSDDGQGNIAAFTVDAKLSTHWTSDATTAMQWIEFNLGSCQNVAYSKLAWYQGDQRKYNFTLKVSANNGLTWTTVASGPSAGTSTGLVTTDFPDISANRVRLESTGNNVNKKVSLSEAEVWTLGAGNCSSSSSSSSSSAQSSSSSSSKSSSSSVSSSQSSSSSSSSGVRPPGAFFDLSKWKIQLPYNTVVAGRPASPATYNPAYTAWPNAYEVYPVELSGPNGYKDTTMFWADAEGNMVFRADSYGNTTSNSSYPRSELRELLDPYDFLDPTIPKNNWVNSNYVNPGKSKWPATKADAGAIDGTMRATVRIDHVTLNGDKDHKGRTIIGQIHASTKEPVKLIYTNQDGATANSLGAISFNNEPTEGGGEQEITLVPKEHGIKLGEWFDYEIKLSGLTLTVTVTKQSGEKFTSTFMLDTGVNGDWMYFKAGVYNLDNKDTGAVKGDYAQVSFKRLQVIHP